jgi:hypothetical protein
VNVVELSNKVLEVGWRQLFNDVVLNQLYKKVVRVRVLNVLVADKFGSLLFLALLLTLFLALFLLLALLLRKHHHVS